MQVLTTFARFDACC